MGLRIITDSAVTVYRKDRETSNGGKFTTYCIGVSSKDKDGNWVNGFMDCVFKKDVSVNNKAKINISNAFPTVSKYTNKDGKEVTQIRLMIMDFYVVEPGEGTQTNNAPKPNDNFMKIDDNAGDFLPFD